MRFPRPDDPELMAAIKRYVYPVPGTVGPGGTWTSSTVATRWP